MRSVVACCLLMAGFVLPLSAWAVDTDGDGVDDSVDAFPALPEATTDTDGDGQPDVINYNMLPVIFSDTFEGTVFQAGWTYDIKWSVSGGYASFEGSNGSTGALQRVFSVPAGGGRLTFSHKRLSTGGNGDLVVNGGAATQTFLSPSWRTAVVNLAAGLNTVVWTGKCTGSPISCIGTDVQLDDVVLRNQSLLVQDSDDDNDGVLDVTDRFPLDATESVDTDNDGIGNNADTDDDNDGVPDYIDADPLNAAINTEKLLLLNNNYQGSAMRESQAVQ